MLFKEMIRQPQDPYQFLILISKKTGQKMVVISEICTTSIKNVKK